MDAAIYARYSSLAQNDASIEQQVAVCQEYADTNHFNIVATYADRALSARSDRRPEFQRMMRAAEKKQFEVVVAYKSNRIARNMLHALAYEEKLAKCGVNIVYVKEEFGNNAAGRFALRTMMNLNQFFSENLAEDVLRGLEENARQCKVNGSIPYGYKRGEDGKFAINEDTAPIVQEIFRRIANGEIKASVADDLNRRQVRTQKGGLWKKNSFQNMLKNERYTGVYIYGNVRVPGGMPIIIDRDLFDQVQEMNEITRDAIMTRRRREGVEYLLTGKLFCGYCMEPMVGTSGTSKLGRMYYYYRCNNQAVAHTCKKKPIRKEKIEQVVVAALKACVTSPENVEWMVDMVMKYRQRVIDESDYGYLEARFQENKAATHNIMKAIEMGIITETTKQRLEELEAEQREILVGLNAINRSVRDITREHLLFYFEQFKNGDVENKSFQRKIIRQFLRAVYLFDDHIKIIFDYTEGNAGIEIPLDAESDLSDLESVLIECSTVYHLLPIRTPLRLTMVGKVFVLYFDFD